MKKLKFTQVLSISMMLFAIFFGAGNMIFPPAMGQLAGTNYLQALAGFVLTDAGIAILGIIAVMLVGNSMSDLGNLVSKKFGMFLSISVYLLIGPLFALPRTGSVSFEIALLPYVGNHSFWFSILFTGIFFLVTYYLSSNPNKIVDVVGKYLTPVLLLSIALIFIASFLNPNGTTDLVFGSIGSPQGEYASIPFSKGMIEGYNALDGPAGLAFSVLVINAIQSYGIKERKDIAKYTVICGLGAAFFLTIVYFALTYVGAMSVTSFANGGSLLHAVTNHLFGGVGGIILGITVLFACLTTSIGLTTSFSNYFQTICPKFTYKQIAAVVCIFSFIISNVGLSQLITISLPILIMIYPVTVVLMLLSFLKKYIGNHKMVYILGMLFALVVSFTNGMESAGVTLGFLSKACKMLPFYAYSLGWVVPAVLGACLGFLPIWKKKM
ncbi:MAG: branched-chain amino acid transport system II carrier protein [Bacteroidales bacterium]